MTNQEIFTTVRSHLLAQNARSFDPERRLCVYRDWEGKKCAVGALIPDDIYALNMEGKPVTGGRIQRALKEAGVIESISQSVSQWTDAVSRTEFQIQWDNPQPQVKDLLADLLPSTQTLVLLVSLQWVHDQIDVLDWPKALANVAEAFGLEP
jgi:hypothetical protein